MKDSVISGTGNSRYLKSVSNFLTLYPTYADFAAALIAGTLPIDLNGINADGFDIVGTPLNKSTLLSNLTATALGMTGDPTPNDALATRAVLTGTSDPTTATAGAIQQFYVNTATSVLFICVSYLGNVYTWLKLGVIVDDTISNSSTNPLQNKVVTAQLGTKPTRTTGSGTPTGSANVGDFYNDTTNKLLYVYDGANWKLIATGMKYVTTHITNIITTAQTFTVPTNITGAISVTCVGGGGSGGCQYAFSDVHPTGGKRGERTITNVTLAGGNTVSITIGEGGARAQVDSDGHAGGTTTFGAYVSAAGGAGGTYDSSTGSTSGETGYTYNGVTYGSGSDGTYYNSSQKGGNGVVVLEYDVMVATPQ